MSQLAVKTAEPLSPNLSRRRHRGPHGHRHHYRGHESPYRLRLMRPRFPARKGFEAVCSIALLGCRIQSGDRVCALSGNICPIFDVWRSHARGPIRPVNTMPGSMNYPVNNLFRTVSVVSFQRHRDQSNVTSPSFAAPAPAALLAPAASSAQDLSATSSACQNLWVIDR